MVKFSTVVVSIHALLAECDTPRGLKMLEDKVSIHALLAECDCCRPCSA
nr:MAG TPA: hypothetical protein [Caudoviricetes sp.]